MKQGKNNKKKNMKLSSVLPQLRKDFSEKGMGMNIPLKYNRTRKGEQNKPHLLSPNKKESKMFLDKWSSFTLHTERNSEKMCTGILGQGKENKVLTT